MEERLGQFRRDLKCFDIVLSQSQENKFVQYYELLIRWNSFMNLTAITEWEAVLKKHFIDSLSVINVLPAVKTQTFSVVDIGTGAGFPGIPLKIAFPQIRLTLIDSLQKRVKFLQEVVYSLEMEDVQILHGRAEDFSKSGEKMREAYDLCVSRAVAKLSTLCEFCIPYIKKGGIFVSYKAEKSSEEEKDAAKAIKILGGRIKERKEFYLPNSEISRCLFLIQKEISTPEKYPRKAGLPIREPL